MFSFNQLLDYRVFLVPVMESDDDDVRPANPNFQLNLNLTAAHPRPLSECNRLESASASAGGTQVVLECLEQSIWGVGTTGKCSPRNKHDNFCFSFYWTWNVMLQALSTDSGWGNQQLSPRFVSSLPFHCTWPLHEVSQQAHSRLFDAGCV